MTAFEEFLEENLIREELGSFGLSADCPTIERTGEESLYTRFKRDIWEVLNGEAERVDEGTLLTFLGGLEDASDVVNPPSLEKFLVWTAAVILAKNILDERGDDQEEDE